MRFELRLKKDEGLICDRCQGLMKGSDKEEVPFFIYGKLLAELRCKQCYEVER